MALLGFGASGSLLTLYRRYKGTEVISERWLPWTTAGAGLGMILAVVVISSIQFNPFSMSDDGYELWNGISYLVMVTVPFLFIGATIAIALDAYSEQAGTLYFADLLGAGVGCLSFVVLGLVRPKGCSRHAGTLLVVAMLALASPPKRTVVVVAPLLLVAVFAATLTATFTPCKSKLASKFVNNAGGSLIWTKWSPIFRTDVYAFPRAELRVGQCNNYNSIGVSKKMTPRWHESALHSP